MFSFQLSICFIAGRWLLLWLWAFISILCLCISSLSGLFASLVRVRFDARLDYDGLSHTLLLVPQLTLIRAIVDMQSQSRGLHKSIDEATKTEGEWLKNKYFRYSIGCGAWVPWCRRSLTRVFVHLGPLSKKILVCMIYFPDEALTPSWAGVALSALGYNNHPAKLQMLIRNAFVNATS